jgi:hypothetical protein
MRPLPEEVRSKSHAELLEQLREGARAQFARNAVNWDPAPDVVSRAPDLGRGLLDCYALALHVLWTYQEAYVAEGFVSTAGLKSSVHRILALIGYRPKPGSAACGLQYFRCKNGVQAVLPPGFQVGADADGDLAEATFETLHAIRVAAALNELQPYLPPGTAGPVPTYGAIADVSPATRKILDKPQLKVPGRDGLGAAPALVGQLEGRVAAGRAGDLAQRNAARAQQDALKLADFIRQVENGNGDELCPAALEQLCQELCELQRAANAVVPPATPGRLSESQELLLGQLRRMARRQPSALAALEDALARQSGESDADWSRRLDKIGGFLDALVASLLQEARDQVVLLHGSQALTRLDRQLDAASAFAGAVVPDFGVAPPGTDTLFILPRIEDPERGPQTHTDLLRPGDWLVIGENVTQTAADGEVTRRQRYREALQVVRVRDEIPAGRTDFMTRITFRPALKRRYTLTNAVLLGNIAEISHGEAVREEGVRLGADQPVVSLARGPLTWIRDAQASEGHRPEVTMTVADRSWQRVDDLRRGEATGSIFAVELTSEGQPRVRVGDGRRGARLPGEARVMLQYRVGIGQSGNRAAGAINKLKSSNAAIVASFNPLDVSGGAEPESAERAQRRACAGIHALDRAISVMDVRSLTESYSGVRCAQVFRNSVRQREHYTVVVCGEQAQALTDDERGYLHQFLVARMAPGVAVTVANRKTVWVRAHLRLLIAPGSDPLLISRECRLRLGLDAAPGRPPGLLDPRRVLLGEDVTLSAVYQALSDIENLKAVHVEQLYRVDAPAGRYNRIQVMADELALWPDPPGNSEPVEFFWEESREA